MTSAEKRKYFYRLLMNTLGPYGYFTRYGKIWKYSIEGKYVICISLDLYSDGGLKEIDIAFGSFFQPIHLCEDQKHTLYLISYFWPSFSMRGLYGQGRTTVPGWMDYHSSFVEQVNAILPYLTKTVLPILQINDSLLEYLECVEKFGHYKTMASIIPQGINIEKVTEVAYAYLFLNREKDAIRVIDEYANRYGFAADYVNNHKEIFKYDIEQRISFWKKQQQDAICLRNTIQAGGIASFSEEMERRMSISRNTCTQFFH